MFGVRGQKLLSSNSCFLAVLLLGTLKRDHQRRMFNVTSLELCVLRECEPCGLVIQMAYLTQGKDVRSGGATCASREVGRTALGACRPEAEQAICPAVQTRIWIYNFLAM